MDELYRHIVRNGDKYVIKTESNIWGTYSKLEDALHDRDLLANANWDIGEVLASDEKDNKYYEMDLPDFDSTKNENKYITVQKIRDKEYFIVQKTIGGEQKRFGYYKTFDEAKKIRDELIKNNWSVLV